MNGFLLLFFFAQNGGTKFLDFQHDFLIGNTFVKLSLFNGLFVLRPTAANKIRISETALPPRPRLSSTESNRKVLLCARASADCSGPESVSRLCVCRRRLNTTSILPHVSVSCSVHSLCLNYSPGMFGSVQGRQFSWSIQIPGVVTNSFVLSKRIEL